ncbi:hypothetical protein D8682_05375 [Buttiauxella sp. 3AFRM03]|nr:hypothetical protein D8682_05375 [Buttiauxella sp. 3AFRM03]
MHFPPDSHQSRKDVLAVLMDNSANYLSIHHTYLLILMPLMAECMYAFTVFLACDCALLWMINFPLQLS